MKKATLDQAAKILELISQSGRSSEWVQNELIGSGRFTDLLAVDNLRGINIVKFRDVLGLKQFLAPLLEYVSLITIPATTERFVAKEKFVVNTSKNAPIKISCIWNSFTEWFFDERGKIEKLFLGGDLHCYQLREDLLDEQVIRELGGEEKAETSLTEIFALMAKQPRGEKGILLTNGYANIFYVRDTDGVLPAVYVCWDGDGWDVGTGSFGSPDRWFAGNQVFSRNFVLKSLEPQAK